MRNISEKVDKTDNNNGFRNDTSSLFKKDFLRILNKDEISLLNLLSAFGLSTFPLPQVLHHFDLSCLKDGL